MRFEMEDCNATLTPAVPRLQLSKDLDEDDVGPMSTKELLDH